MNEFDQTEKVLRDIERAFNSAGGMVYLGEDVTMIQHQLQAAALAKGCRDALVVAALLHDIGHVIGHEQGEPDASAALADEIDAHHDTAGACWLSRWFGPDVTEPVRLHVAAKRYLVAAEPGYSAKLSAASVHTLHLQGGPMSTAEVREFEGLPYARDAVTLRRFDEAAKDASRDAPGFDTYRELLVHVLARGSG
jgi:gamma-butyrobetaine dioxygenase